jgi:3-dehydroquinate dehydratase II
MKIIIINGPNLNLLGIRETEIYGMISFDDYLNQFRDQFQEIKIDYFQTNIEGEIIGKLQEFGFNYDGIILNAGGYTHTSIAIADAVKAIKTPVIEVHISNIFNREDYRHVSFLGAFCKGSISGFGLDSYKLALNAFLGF